MNQKGFREGEIDRLLFRELVKLLPKSRVTWYLTRAHYGGFLEVIDKGEKALPKAESLPDFLGVAALARYLIDYLDSLSRQPAFSGYGDEIWKANTENRTRAQALKDSAEAEAAKLPALSACLRCDTALEKGGQQRLEDCFCGTCSSFIRGEAL